MERTESQVASPAPANNYETVGLFLVQNGYSAVGAAGVCGCIAGESGGDPEAVQFPGDPESGGAGLIQWTPASSMEQYGGTCAAAGIGDNSAAADMQNQMNAILAYNNAQGSSNVAELNALTDPVAAADFYSQVFERPVVEDSDVRPSVAQSVYAFLTGTSAPPPPAPVPGQEYTIQAGDTLSSIAAAAYGAANADAGVAAIEAANPGIDPDDLQIGQEITIPVLGDV
jgi:LysM repeat protein